MPKMDENKKWLTGTDKIKDGGQNNDPGEKWYKYPHPPKKEAEWYPRKVGHPQDPCIKK
jgi:hypothetical protein